MFIKVKKVTKEYIDQKAFRQKTLARKAARIIYAKGEPVHDSTDFSDQEVENIESPSKEIEKDITPIRPTISNPE